MFLAEQHKQEVYVSAEQHNVGLCPLHDELRVRKDEVCFGGVGHPQAPLLIHHSPYTNTRDYTSFLVIRTTCLVLTYSTV